MLPVTPTPLPPRLKFLNFSEKEEREAPTLPLKFPLSFFAVPPNRVGFAPLGISPGAAISRASW